MQIRSLITSTVLDLKICYTWSVTGVSMMATASAPLYIRIAEGVIEQIENGTLRAGEKVVSIRRLSRQQRVSISTALQAYMWLENRGHLEARPKSGFFVRRPFASLIPEPRFAVPRTQPHLLGTND